MSLRAGDRLGPYEILAPIGKGGMGEVYRARDTGLRRDVALKVLPAAFSSDPDRMARFQREAQVLASLDHPNIGHIYGIVESDGTRALALALVEGPTLADRIAGRALPQDEAMAIAKQIIEALEYAHDRGVVHRDLKPANIKISADGVVKVLDFGLAKVLEDEPPAASIGDSPTLTLGHTRAGTILGTAAYMSPEQAVGRPVDRRSDIFSFGAVLYEMLTGERAFAGATTPDVLEAVVKSDPDWSKLRAQTSPALERVLRRCLKKDRKLRLQAIGEARIALENPESGAEVPGQAGAPPRGMLWWKVAAAALLLALFALGFVHFREAPPEQRTVRFNIAPPEKASFQYSSISPDGRTLAFVAGGQLWIRALDSLEARPLLPETDVVDGPFWSPDSQFVGFVRRGKLRKVAVSGGPAQVLCDATGFFTGGTWSRDGVIVFGQLPSLFRVSEAGGTPIRVTKGEAGQAHDFPEFLPDDHHFLYAVTAVKAEAAGIFVGSLDGEPPARLLPDISNARYAPVGQSGYLMFMRGDTLMAQAFEPERRRLSGSPFPAAEGVSKFLTVAGVFSVSRNGTLVYAPGGDSVTTQLVWKDRSGRSIENFGPPGIYDDFRLAPDEKRIAFDIGHQDVWVLDSVGGAALRLTFDPAADDIPMWSPDGLRIVWPSKRGGSGFDLYIKSANGTGPENLLLKMGTPTGWASDWSRDGRFILYQMPGPKTGQELWIAPQLPEGASGDRSPYPYLQSQFDEKDGKFSPDGKWVAYVSNGSGRDEIYVQSFPLSGAKFQISTMGGVEPQWRKDGSELFYISADEMLMAVPVKLGRTPGESFQADRPKPLFAVVPAETFIGRDYAVSNDGQRFLVRSAAGGNAPPLVVLLNWQAGVKK